MTRQLRLFLKSQNLTLLLICIAGAAIVTASSGGAFLSPVSITTFFQFLAVPILIGLAQMVTLSVGQLNLAVGSIGGFAACLAGVLMADFGVAPWLGALIAIAVGGLAGLINGWLVVGTRINGFIVTLATMTILAGAQYGLVGTRTISNSNWRPLADLGRAAPLGIPAIFWITIVVAIVVSLAFAHVAAFRRMLASGDNAVAAGLAGVSNDRSLVLAHAMSGLLCGVAAFIALASLSGVNNSVGGDWMLSSFAAPIIGGVLLTGGSVAVLGTILAAAVIRLVDSARAVFQLDPSWVNFVIGAVVLGTVALGRLRGRRTPTRVKIETNRPAVPTPTGSQEKAGAAL